MSNNVPLFVIGLPKDDFAKGLLMSKFKHTLEKGKKILPEIIEAKIAVETQNPEGSRTHYEVRATITTAKFQKGRLEIKIPKKVVGHSIKIN